MDGVIQDVGLMASWFAVINREFAGVIVYLMG